MTGTFTNSEEGVVGFYGCKRYGLPRALDSYIPRDDGVHRNVYTVIACTDGLVLLRTGELTYRVGNPLLNQWVHLPRCPSRSPLSVQPTGLVTRVEDGVVFAYKVVFMDFNLFEDNPINFHVYSSETGTWTLKQVQCPYVLCQNSLCLNKMLHWLQSSYNSLGAIVAYDFYDGNEEQQCRVIPFPDQNACFRRAYTASGGPLVYINNTHLVLRLWRLEEYTSDSGRWKFMHEISLRSFGCDHRYFPMAMHPFESHIIYMGSPNRKLVSIDLKRHKLTLYNKSSTYNDPLLSRYLSIIDNVVDRDYHKQAFYTPQFVLPQWMASVPRPPSI